MVACLEKFSGAPACLPACLPSHLPARLPACPPACLPACLPARLPAKHPRQIMGLRSSIIFFHSKWKETRPRLLGYHEQAISRIK